MNLCCPSAKEWNELAKTVCGGRPLPGVGVELRRTPEGVSVSANPSASFRHPWQLTPVWKDDQWQVIVRPGFVDGLPPKIKGTYITEKTPPALTPNWRDPVSGSASVTSEGISYTAAAEGYPKFFEMLGVRIADVSSLSTAATYDPSSAGRTRELRACDIVLSTPRLATLVDLTLSSPDSGSIVTGGVATWGDTSNIGKEFTLYTTPMWTPQSEPSPVEWLTGSYGEPTVDEIKIATLYMVSPSNPDDPSGDPDGSWVPYTKYNVFWNLNYATQHPADQVHYNAITFRTGFPLADMIIPSFLSENNDAANAVALFYNNTSFKGKFYTA